MSDLIFRCRVQSTRNLRAPRETSDHNREPHTVVPERQHNAVVTVFALTGAIVLCLGIAALVIQPRQADVR